VEHPYAAIAIALVEIKKEVGAICPDWNPELILQVIIWLGLCFEFGQKNWWADKASKQKQNICLDETLSIHAQFLDRSFINCSSRFPSQDHIGGLNQRQRYIIGGVRRIDR
jgi:hypothetical protein